MEAGLGSLLAKARSDVQAPHPGPSYWVSVMQQAWPWAEGWPRVHSGSSSQGGGGSPWESFPSASTHLMLHEQYFHRTKSLQLYHWLAFHMGHSKGCGIWAPCSLKESILRGLPVESPRGTGRGSWSPLVITAADGSHSPPGLPGQAILRWFRAACSPSVGQVPAAVQWCWRCLNRTAALRLTEQGRALFF